MPFTMVLRSRNEYPLEPYTVNFKDVWLKLKPAIKTILTLQAVPRATWEYCFNATYKLCVSPLERSGDKLYEATEEVLEKHVESLYKEIANSIDFLLAYGKCWRQFREGMGYLNQFLKMLNAHYVDRQTYPLQSRELGTCCSRRTTEFENTLPYISELGLDLWKTKVIQPLGRKLSWFLLVEIANDRRGKCGCPLVLKEIIQSLVEVIRSPTPTELYVTIFESHFLATTREYYKIKANKEIQNGSWSQYMKKIFQWLKEEKLRSNKFLHPTTLRKEVHEIIEVTVIDHVNYMHAGFKETIGQEGREIDFQNAYRLMLAVKDGFDPMASELQAHVTKVGCDAMNCVTDKDAEIFVETFLQVREKYLKIVKECYSSNEKFVEALNKACTVILKCEGNKSCAGKSHEMLANYCDIILKKGSSDEVEMEEKLSKSLIVFKYVENKDIFQTLYGQKLASRLVFNKSASLYAEESMINKLKEFCGHEYTKRYLNMFSDMALRKEFNELFVPYMKSVGLYLHFSVDVAILRTSAWPFNQKSIPFAVPQELERCILAYEKFYNSKYHGRRLHWIHQMSTADVKLGYLNKPYIISMSTFQMALLLLFEEHDQLTYAEMKDCTQMEDDNLSRVLRSLTETKLLIAVDKDVADTNVSNSAYILNKKYSNHKIKIKIPPAAKKDGKVNAKKEIQKVIASTDEIRKMHLEPTIVRIMKTRKKLKHDALIQEVIMQVRKDFIPKMALIKKCIDHLIDMEYLERSPDCHDEYLYIS